MGELEEERECFTHPFDCYPYCKGGFLGYESKAWAWQKEQRDYGGRWEGKVGEKERYVGRVWRGKKGIEEGEWNQ